MSDAWVIEETQNLDLNDKRLNERLRTVLRQLGKHPAASIPVACGGHAEMTAAYRMLDNDKVSFENVLEPHRCNSTRDRIAAQKIVLLVQDTTEIDLTRPENHVQGTGPLAKSSRQGLFLHLLHAFTPDGTPLGTAHAKTWVREPGPPICANRSRAQSIAIPIEKKESFRWLETQRIANQQASICPDTHLISITDSESDIYELLAEPVQIDWIVRACHDRTLVPDDETASPRTIRAYLLTQPVLYNSTISIRGRKAKVACETRARRQPRCSRQASVEVRSAPLSLRPPWRPDRKLPEITINAVFVREVDPPANDEPVEWLLLTSLPIADEDQVCTVVEYYKVRWMIEILFRVLKSGCKIEKRRFEHIDRVLPCLAIYLIVAWRTLYVCRLSRSCPDIDCEAVFEPAEWKAVWKISRKTDPPSQPPPLGEFTIMVAQLGGYIMRKNSPPGPKTIWIGLQRTYDFGLCWKNFGPESNKSRDV
jgi:hypothetical protein